MNAAAQMPVRFDTRSAGSNGRRVGIITLDTPQTLNSLSLPMAKLLDAQLGQWAGEPDVAMVILQGAGEKAFCAGGDLHALYEGMLKWRQSGSNLILDNTYAAEFFKVEYRLDHRIHTWDKPILCWGHGIVMGGGIGLMAGASHRVVSERSRLAFPEISVGLFPDVGGSWLLNRVPGRAGPFLALTGAPLNAGDAIHAGLADLHLPEASRDAVIAAILAQDWSDSALENHGLLDRLLAGFATPAAAGPLQEHAAQIADIGALERLEDMVAAIQAIDPGDDTWLANAKKTLAAGSPGSARLGYELQRRAADMSLADTFRMEYIAALHCAAHGDFAEGIRALLIDKDRQPNWQPATLEEADAAFAARFLEAPAWPRDRHPLAELGNG